MPKLKASAAHAGVGQRLKELRQRYGWKPAQIFADTGRVTQLEAGRGALDAELAAAYLNAFRVDQRTFHDYRDGLITCDEFMVRAGVQPGDDEPAGIPSKRVPEPPPPRLAPWEHDEVEELLAIALVARGMPTLVANVVVRSERLKLRDYPTWPLRIAHMESVREASEEDARLVQPKKKPQLTKAPPKHSLRAAPERASRSPKAKPSGVRTHKSSAPGNKRG